MDTTSHWLKTAKLPRFPRLEDDVTVDVAVVGGGITGITAAYLLKQAGLTVALLERGRCAHVDTGRTTAHCTAVPDLGIAPLLEQFGPDAARAVWSAGALAMERVGALSQALGIDCGFQTCPGFLHLATRESDATVLREEIAAAERLGLPAAYEDAVPVFGVPGLRFGDTAVFHPLAYLAGLLTRLPGNGSHVFEDSDAHETDAHPRRLHTAHGSVRFSHVVYATHNHQVGHASLARATLLQTKLALYSSYALCAEVPSGSFAPGCYWDTDNPYHYLRAEGAGEYDLLIYGGEDHKTGQVSDTHQAYERLELRLRDLAPEARVTSRWSGQVIETNDGLPFIGELADREFVATGFAGNGTTFGTLAGMMAVDYVLGRENRWRQLFDPHRQKFRGGFWSYLKENKDYPLHLLRGRLRPPDAESVRELARGEGRLLSLEGRRIAAYRDERGRILLCSAVCPHMQCIVNWNPAEKTWDCPCHGSRFLPNGAVFSGPAEEPLLRLSPLTGRALGSNGGGPRRRTPSVRS